MVVAFVFGPIDFIVFGDQVRHLRAELGEFFIARGQRGSGGLHGGAQGGYLAVELIDRCLAFQVSLFGFGEGGGAFGPVAQGVRLGGRQFRLRLGGKALSCGGGGLGFVQRGYQGDLLRVVGGQQRLVVFRLGDHQHQQYRAHQREDHLEHDQNLCESAQGKPPLI